MQKIDYNQYLFIQILGEYEQDFKSLPYDIQYKEGVLIYNHDFLDSKYNDTSKPLYDCIVLFIKNKNFNFKHNF